MTWFFFLEDEEEQLVRKQNQDEITGHQAKLWNYVIQDITISILRLRDAVVNNPGESRNFREGQ